LTGDAVDHGVGGRETRRNLVVAGLSQHDPGDRRPLAVDPAEGPEGEAAAGRGGRAGLDADKPVVPEQCVGVVHGAGDRQRRARCGDLPCSAGRASSFCSWTETMTTPRHSPAPTRAPARPARFGLPSGCTTCRPEHGSVSAACAVWPNGGSPIAHAGRGWFRAAALERAAFERLAGGVEIDLLLCHDPRTLEQGTQARGPFAALAAKLRPALVIYGHQHRPHGSAAGQPALVGLGSFRDGRSSAVVLDSDETGRLVRALRRRTATQQEAA
jgi:hypothetical protein